MIHKLHNLNILADSSHPQFPQRQAETTSPTLIIIIRAPQGYVLSPFLYLLYTTDTSPPPSIKYQKYSDDTARLALLEDNNSIMDYHTTVSHFT